MAAIISGAPVETERLYILPLKPEHLLFYIAGNSQLESELGIHPFSREHSTLEVQALQQIMVPRVVNSKTAYHYTTLWLIIIKKDRIVIGDLFFKGAPDEKGEMEIGYGIYPRHRGKGYMKEALAGVIGWAIRQKEVRVLVAEAALSNIASLRLLQQNGFTVFRQDHLSAWLKISTPKKLIAKGL